MAKNKTTYKLIQVIIEEDHYNKVKELSDGKVGEFGKEAILAKIKALEK